MNLLSFFLHKPQPTNGIRMSRTKEGTIFEIACLMLNILLWIMAAWMWSKLPDTVPTHFDASGHPNQYSGKAFGLIFPCAICAFVSILIMLSVYLPSKNISGTQITNITQMVWVARGLRIIGVLMPLLFMSIFGVIGYETLGWPAPLHLVTATLTGAIVLIPLLFIILALFKGKRA